MLKGKTAQEGQAVAERARDLAGFERGFASPGANSAGAAGEHSARIGPPCCRLGVCGDLLVSSSATYYFWPRPIVFSLDRARALASTMAATSIARGCRGAGFYSGDSVNVPYIGSKSAFSSWVRKRRCIGASNGDPTAAHFERQSREDCLGANHARYRRPCRPNALSDERQSNATLTVKGTAFTLRVAGNGCLRSRCRGCGRLAQNRGRRHIVLPSHYAVTGMRAPLKSDSVYGIKREAWLAGTAPSPKMCRLPLLRLSFEDYAFRSQTFMWEYPFLQIARKIIASGWSGLSRRRKLPITPFG